MRVKVGPKESGSGRERERESKASESVKRVNEETHCVPDSVQRARARGNYIYEEDC